MQIGQCVFPLNPGSGFRRTFLAYVPLSVQRFDNYMRKAIARVTRAQHHFAGAGQVVIKLGVAERERPVRDRFARGR